MALTIGGVAAQGAFAGLAPGFAGLYQIKATVPADVPSGPVVPLVVKMGLFYSLLVTVAVQ
jgi:uncharacterized protein (TIGR03437 family)